MNRFIDFIGKWNVANLYKQVPVLPDFGPVDIPNYQEFLARSKEGFFDKWNSLLKETQSQEQFTKSRESKVLLKDFKKIKLIGSGSFGQVYLVKHNPTSQYHAMKAVLKRTVVELKQVENTKTEKLVLQCTNCPFTLRLNYFFKDNSYLYFILPFIQGGELFNHLKACKRFEEVLAMFYLAQVILALEYLHYLDIVYRDLKPENILIDHTGYLKLTDFGFCKLLKDGRTYTLCGTPEYLAPEILNHKGYGKSVDWWGVGILAFELTTGHTPFKEKQPRKMFERIIKGSFSFPDFLGEDLKDLITNALQVDLSMRFGTMKNGVSDFKTHKWFRTVNWNAVACRKAKPSHVPICESPSDTRNFRKYEYRSLEVAGHLEYGEEFADF